MSHVRIGSLFSGIGGLDLGLEYALREAGHTTSVEWQCDSDPFCLSILSRRWPNATRFPSILSLHSPPPVDLLCGGFPCQDISTAGRQAGIHGERSGLWHEFLRIIVELQPRAVVIENVSALASNGLSHVLGGLASAGYDALWFTLRASDAGAPHRRERLFIVAHSSGSGPQRQGKPRLALHPEENRDRQASGALHESGRENKPLLGGVPHGIPPILDHLFPAPPGEQHPWEPPRTAPTGPHRSDRLKALGNAVVPQVAYLVGRAVLPFL